MKLSIDTTDSHIIALVFIEGKSEKIETLVVKSLTSQNLLPFIDSMLRKNGYSYSDIKEIEIQKGPGSYTGIRVGLSIVHTFGYLLHIPINGKMGDIIEPIYDYKDKFQSFDRDLK